MSEIDLESKILEALRDEKLYETLLLILRKEKELRQRYPDHPSWWDWEIGDIGAEPWHVIKLLRMGIVKRTYASSKHKYYKLVDYELTLRLVQQYSSNLSKVKAKKKSGRLAPKCNPVPSTPEELFDVVVGYDDYKWAIWKALKKWEKGAKPAHFLLEGPPATGKTLMIECIETKIGCCVYVASENARKGGLTDRIIEAYNVYGKQFILLLDEIDKMDSEAMKLLYNLMEGRLDISRRGSNIYDPDVRVMVIATSNQLYKVPEAIRSRFGKPLSFKYYGYDDFVEVSILVLTKLEGIEYELAEYISKYLADKGIRDPRVPRQIARIVDTKEEVDRVFKILFKK